MVMVMYYLNPTTSRLSWLLHESEAEPRTIINKNDNLRVQWDLSGFYPITFDVHDHAWRQAIGALEAHLLQFAWEWPVEFNYCGTEKKDVTEKSQKRSE